MHDINTNQTNTYDSVMSAHTSGFSWLTQKLGN